MVDMTEELMEILKRKYQFLGTMLESVDLTIRELKRSGDSEEVYNTMITFLGEFPTKRMLQIIAEEKNLGIKVKTREDAINVIKLLQ
ncbi:Conserved hypothetical protein [Thermococcus gammatolerans EJ3]|uniref:Uncharacterized protein n=2 Tax=Thermococcus TaxID=2263 RepID=C5A468_THEGJ|nr:Conserved hypothetical protein [Thermococcus gammatolerans EJ3]